MVESQPKELKPVYAAARFIVSFLILFYGFAKLNGSQFTILASELDKPMGSVSGFWLTWYYFGYSPVYGNFIALVQILAGVLLMFRRTTLLGACLLFPVVTNIILIDIVYGIDLGALLVALVIESAVLLILALHMRELIQFFWSKQNSLFPSTPSSRIWVVGKYAVRALLIVTPAIFTYWVANYNNRAPTAIDGSWNVVSASGRTESDNAMVTIFFERNRAYLCVFKRKDGSYESHHFEIDGNKKTISIWEKWMDKGGKVFDGNYELSGDQMRLSGRFAGSSEETVLFLKKRKTLGG